MKPEITEYIPEQLTVPKDDIYAAIQALEVGLFHAQDALSRHDTELGRHSRRGELWAKQIEQDIANITSSIQRLRSFKPWV